MTAEARVVPHERLPVPGTGDEKAMLSAFLDRYRDNVLFKLDGVSTEQASQRIVPSATTLLGVVKHLAYVERGWFQHRFAGRPEEYPWPEDDPDPDVDFRIGPEDTVDSVRRLYEQECAISREIVAGASLDDVAASSPPGRGPFNLRWIMVHMIEETARHAGHADILRELTDGAIGQ
jgi:uncharacterized damage-inducible protein DinB